MVETFGNVVMSGNGIAFLFFCLVIFVFILFFSKKGLVFIKTKYLQIGGARKERNIIRYQIEYLKTHYQGMEKLIIQSNGYESDWKGKYVIEVICDEFVDWITFNHMTADDIYIGLKQEKIIDIVKSFSDDPSKYPNEETINIIKDDIKQLILKLIQIRQLYIHQPQ